VPDKPRAHSLFLPEWIHLVQLRHESAADFELHRKPPPSWDLDETMFGSPQFWEAQERAESAFQAFWQALWF
jgi:hypothetical protein